MMDERVGQQLGNYRLLRLLGQGGFADVYLGEHIHLGTQAAIKVLQVRLVENNIQSFLNEARTIAHLVHPYIIRVLDFGVQGNTPFLVMDYAPKGTFRQRFLAGKPLPPTPLFPYIKQTAQALQYAHDKKLIHRDVKPENMLLGPNEEVLLSDFGFALIHSSISRTPTETAGTAAYMAPEQLQGKPCPASDQYSLGIVAYEWLTGNCPFNGSFFEIASQHMLAEPPSLHKKIPGISLELEHVVMKALAKDPQQRYPTVRDFATSLERACLTTKSFTMDVPLVPPPFLSQPTPSKTMPPVSTPKPLEGDKGYRSGSFPVAQSLSREPLKDVNRDKQMDRPAASEWRMQNNREGEDAGKRAVPPQLSQRHQPGEDAVARAKTLGDRGGKLGKDVSQANIASALERARQSLANIPAVGAQMSFPEAGGSSFPSPIQKEQEQLQKRFSQSGIRPLGTPPPVQGTGSAPVPQENFAESPQQRFSQSGIRPLGTLPSMEATFPPFAPPAATPGEQRSRMSQQSAEERRFPAFPAQQAVGPQSQPLAARPFVQPSIQPFRSEQSSLPGLPFTPPNFPEFPPVKEVPRSLSTDMRTLLSPPRQPKVRRPLSLDVLALKRPRNNISTALVVFLLAMIVFIIIGGVGLFSFAKSQTAQNAQTQATQQAVAATAKVRSTATAMGLTATALANANPYTHMGVLVMNDPLSANTLQGANWQETPAACQFTDGRYHAMTVMNGFTTCIAAGTNYTNFAYEVQMTFVKEGRSYTSGGLIFRSNGDGQYYYFEMYPSGRYIFAKCDVTTGCTSLAGGANMAPLPATTFNGTTDQPNTIAVIGNNGVFTIYVNHIIVVDAVKDETYSHGKIGVLAGDGNQTGATAHGQSPVVTDVAFANVKVWTW